MAKKQVKKLRRKYLLEVVDNSHKKTYFHIVAQSLDDAHEQSETLVKQYMSAVAKSYQHAEMIESPLLSIGPLLDKLDVDPAHLLEQAQISLVNPEYSDITDEGLEILAKSVLQKGKQGPVSPIRETFLWQIREVQ